MNISDYLKTFERRDWQTREEGTVRIAMIALGWWTREKAIPAVQDSSLCETTVVVSGSKEKANEVAGKSEMIQHGLTYDEFQDGAATEAYDAVYVCTPNALHLPHVETAAKLNKAILCEKPMEASVERAEELVKVAEANDATLMIAYRMQTEPAVRRARELVRDGVIGQPMLVHGENSQPLLEIIDDPDQWRLNPDLTGYGTSVMDLGIYPLNTARFVLDADPVTVQAMMRSDHDIFENVPDEQATFTVAFDDGTYVSCTASQNAHQETRLEIVGTEGRIELEPAFHMETSFTVERGGITVDVETDKVNQMEFIFDYFANRVLDEEPMYADGKHGLVDMRTIEAIHEAAEIGRTIDVSE